MARQGRHASKRRSKVVGPNGRPTTLDAEPKPRERPPSEMASSVATAGNASRPRPSASVPSKGKKPSGSSMPRVRGTHRTDPSEAKDACCSPRRRGGASVVRTAGSAAGGTCGGAAAGGAAILAVVAISGGGGESSGGAAARPAAGTVCAGAFVGACSGGGMGGGAEARAGGNCVG